MNFKTHSPVSVRCIHKTSLPLLASSLQEYLSNILSSLPQDSYNLIVPPAPPLKVSSKLLPRKTFIIGKYLASALSLLLSAATCVPWDSVEQKYLATTVLSTQSLIKSMLLSTLLIIL